MEIPLEKFNGHNFDTRMVKIQMQSKNKSLWGVVKGTETEPARSNKIITWQSRDDKAKSIIGLAISDSEPHHVDLDKFSKEIWEELNQLFGSKALGHEVFLETSSIQVQND